MRVSTATRLTLVLMTVFVLSCGGGSSSSPTEPARPNSLVLLSVEPVQGTSVRLGGEIQVVARFRYTLQQAGGGKIGVLVFPLPFGLPLVTDPLPAETTVAGQAGEVTVRFKIPLHGINDDLSSGPIAVNFALFPQGQRESVADVQVRYELIP